MDPLTIAAASALVKVLSSDSWQVAKSAVVRLWRREDPERQSAVSQEVDATRRSVLAARATNDETAEQRLAAQWHRQLSGLAGRSPEASAELQDFLDQEIRPLLPDQDQEHVITVQQQIHAGRDAYVAGRDMNIFGGQTINER